MKKKIQIIATVKDGLAIARGNYFRLIATTFLYLLSSCIPYINIGTSIAVGALPAEMIKGKEIDPFYIFDSKYRRNMGEYLILVFLMLGAVFMGFFMGIIPGLVISIAWSFAAVLFVDKNMNSLEALRESNRLTYGNKWRIFAAEMLPALVLTVLVTIVAVLCGIGNHVWLNTLGALIDLVIVIIFVPALYGVQASIYKQLTEEEPIETPVEVQ